MRDVIVIGGGPAGSTVSTLLARQGFSVTLLEKERFPRHEYLRFIERFYDREFLEVFLQPSERCGLLDAVVGVLAGDVFTNRDNRFKLALFFFLVQLQKWRGVIAPAHRLGATAVGRDGRLSSFPIR